MPAHVTNILNTKYYAHVSGFRYPWKQQQRLSFKIILTIMIKAAHCWIVLHQEIGDTMSTAESIYYAVRKT